MRRMCGFGGEFVFDAGVRADIAVAEAMAAGVAHRGPDDRAAWISRDGRCAIGFRRLAVIDPPLSAQPMVSPDQAVAVAFNGEIYNYRQLRAELTASGYRFRTRGDTEVLLALWVREAEQMLHRLEGMFALVIYDERAGQLFAARDRLGVKPLWYVVLDDRLVFASEAKALWRHGGVPREIDPEAVGLYLTMGYVPAPRSIWRGVKKLSAGHCLTARARAPAPLSYWVPPRCPSPVGPDPAVQVRQVVADAVERRLHADVPMGVLLSGGVDSAIVAALACRHVGAAGGIKTFTAGFAEAAFDERAAAQAVARHIGSEHHELLVTAPAAADLVDELVGQYDEPFADSSAVATWLICRAARQHVTVALTGDGADEALGGYERYWAMRLAETMGPGRFLAVKAAAAGASFIAPCDERSRLRRLVRFAAALNEPPSRQYLAYRRLFAPDDLAWLLEPDFADAARLDAAEAWFCDLYEDADFDDEIARAQHHDLRTYLPDDLLVKADIASMASGLELRSPMLDPQVLTLGLSLPPEAKWRHRRGKAILREAFADLLPAGAFARPKMGFGVPVDGWLRGDLLGVLRETVLDGPLVEQGWLVRSAAEEMIARHLARRDDHRHRLWALLCLGRWLAREP